MLLACVHRCGVNSVIQPVRYVWHTDETKDEYAGHDTSRKKKKKGSPVNLSGLLLELEQARGTVW